MLYIFWEFKVRPERVVEFERRYGSQADWTALFRRANEFHKTVLGRSTHAVGHYLVTDILDDAESFARFKQDFRETYSELDKICEALTIEERHVGDFEPL